MSEGGGWGVYVLCDVGVLLLLIFTWSRAKAHGVCARGGGGACVCACVRGCVCRPAAAAGRRGLSATGSNSKILKSTLHHASMQPTLWITAFLQFSEFRERRANSLLDSKPRLLSCIPAVEGENNARN